MIPVFLPAGHRVVAPDLIGFGKSDKPKKDGFHTFTWHRQVLLELVERLDLQQRGAGGAGLGRPARADPADGRAAALPRPAGHEHHAGHRRRPADARASSPGATCARRTRSSTSARLFARGNPQMSAAECAAYKAPFPDRGHRAALRAFPPMVPDDPDADGAAISRAGARILAQTHGPAAPDGDRRAGPGAGPAGDAGACSRDPRLPGAHGARAGRPLRAGAWRAIARRRWDISRSGNWNLTPISHGPHLRFSPSSAVRDKAAFRRG